MAYISDHRIKLSHRPQELTASNDPHPGYQFIFVTSNIAHEVETDNYTIGEYYTQINKSLKNLDFEG